MSYFDKYFPVVDGYNVKFDLSYEDLVGALEEEPLVVVPEDYGVENAVLSINDSSYTVTDISIMPMPDYSLLNDLIVVFESLSISTIFDCNVIKLDIPFSKQHEVVADLGPIIYQGGFVDNIVFPDMSMHRLTSTFLKTLGVYDCTVGVISANNVSSICHGAREHINGKDGIFFSLHSKDRWFTFQWDELGARYYGLGKFCGWYRKDDYGTNWIMWGNVPDTFLAIKRDWFVLNFDLIERSEGGVEMLVDGTVYVAPRHKFIDLKCCGLDGLSLDGEVYQLTHEAQGFWSCLCRDGKFVPFEKSISAYPSGEIGGVVNSITSLDLFEHVLVSNNNVKVDLSLRCTLVLNKFDINKNVRIGVIPFFSNLNGTKKCMTNRYVKDFKRYPLELPRRKFFFLDNKLRSTVPPFLPTCLVGTRDYRVKVVRVESGDRLRKYGFDPYHALYNRKNKPFYLCLKE